MAFILTWFLLAPATYASPPTTRGPNATCIITNRATLQACASHASDFRVLAFAADVTSAATTCGPANGPAITIRGTGLTIDGKGHTWYRQSPLDCTAVAITGAHNIEVRDLVIVENPQALPCELTRKRCPNTVDIVNSSNVVLDGVRIYDGKGSVVHVWHTDGFTFTHGVIANAGVIGLYVGHWKYGTSSDIEISHSVFAHARTNAVAIQGANGVTIRDSIFNDNHWHGLWPVAGVTGGITSGGQLLLDDAVKAVVTGNLFANAACGNCLPRAQTVSTIELGGTNRDPGVHGVAITDNTALNVTGTALYQNPGSSVSGVRITGNHLRGRMVLDNIHDAFRSGNVIAQSPSPRLGRTTSEAFRIRVGGTLHTAASTGTFPGGAVDAAFALSPAPMPGGPAAPLLLCVSGTSDFPSARADCGGRGTPTALLGFAFSSHTQGARPFFLCVLPSAPANRFLSWQRSCDGGTMVAELGSALQGPP